MKADILPAEVIKHVRRCDYCGFSVNGDVYLCRWGSQIHQSFLKDKFLGKAEPVAVKESR